MASLVLPGVDRVASLAQLVTVNQHEVWSAGLTKAAEEISRTHLSNMMSPHAFDTDTHYMGPSALTAQYLLVVDTLNFCFWPEPGLEYENLAKSLKALVAEDPGALSAARLAQADGSTIQHYFRWPRPVPLQDLRASLVREVGEKLQQGFQGRAECLIQAAAGSAPRLVELVTAAFPGFRDEAQYRGESVRLYKRAQIFVGDVWGAFQGRGLGEFRDIDQLTMFADADGMRYPCDIWSGSCTPPRVPQLRASARSPGLDPGALDILTGVVLQDYRVPVVLRQLGILEYAPDLAAKVEAKEALPAGSPEEVEIRACTIVAVERLKAALASAVPPGTATPTSLQLDWWLWEEGERNRSAHPPHHRTLTTFY